MIGEVLGNYRVLSEIGKGGMGEVFLAQHTLIGRRVAVKVLLRQFSLDQSTVNRFFNEARAAAKIHHPGLVEVFDFGHHTDGSAYIVMELLVGESLSARISRDGRLAPAVALAIARQVAIAIEAAHQQGIVHRDLKPENIYLLPDPESSGGVRVKVLDFGIAKLANDETPRSVKTKTGAVFGTPRYMAPEQCRNAGTVDCRADIYALGCILFEMLIGRAPFDFDSWGELVAAHLHLDPPRPRELDPELPSAIELLVMRALAKKPADRYASMAELADAIEAVWRQSGEGRASLFTPPKGLTVARAPTSPTSLTAGAPTLPVAAEVSVPPPRGRRVPWLLIGGAAVVAIAIGAFVMLRGGDEEHPVVAEAPRPVVQPVVVDAPPPPPQITAPPEPTKVQLVVDSVPSGADVYRRSDGARLGKTPLTRSYERLEGGEIEFVIRRSGYQDKSIALSIAHDGKQVAKLVPVRAARPTDHVKPSNGSGSATILLDPYEDKK
jgi:serine/threonine-protein kinase